MNAKACWLLSLTLLLGACEETTPTPQGFAGLGQASDAFLAVTPQRTLQFPADHGAHSGYRIEWWYVTANLTDEQGRDWGAQWTLFRSALRPGADQAGWHSPNLWMGHAGLSGSFGHQVAETLARGGVGQAGVEAQPFHAWIDDWSLRSTHGSGLDHLQMQARGDGFAYRLQLDSEGPLVLHGKQGYSEKSGQGQASYYYSQPFYRVSGEIERDGQRYRVSGQAWLDREWSSQPLAAQQQGWDWFSLHLQGGAKLMLFQVRQADDEPYRAGTWIAADGQTRALSAEQIHLTPLHWSKQQTGRKVPTQWRVEVPTYQLSVEVQAIETQAWMTTRFPYWEGPVRLSGSHQGRGYLEMTGY
jgi:predicted secreted hydrolase